MRKKENLSGYLFIAPWCIGFIGLTVVPFACLLFFSFTRFDLLSNPVVNGLWNFADIFLRDDTFWTSLRVTFVYVLISVPLRLAVALAVAVILNQRHRLIGLYRTTFYLPSIIGASVAVAVMWRNVFTSDGLFNAVIAMITGVRPGISWISDPRTALGSLIALSVWQFGSSMLIFLAGLKDIPASYYEAAVIDGANSIKKFSRITVPLLSPVIFFNVVMQIINGFMTFTQGLVITNGGPMNRTLFYQLYVYQRGFQYFNMGYASALSTVLLTILGLLTLVLFRSSDRWVFYETK